MPRTATEALAGCDNNYLCSFYLNSCEEDMYKRQKDA